MIFLDFDGTIVDIWRRYFDVFTTIGKIHSVSFQQYVAIKRQLRLDNRVADYFDVTLPTEYLCGKRRRLEDIDALKLDSLILPPNELLAFFHEHECRILTSRRCATTYREQLIWLGLDDLYKKSIILNPDWGQNKTDYLSSHFSHGVNVLVGDSEAEQEATRLTNMHVVLVKTGLRNPEDFPVMENCTIVDDISEFIVKNEEQW